MPTQAYPVSVRESGPGGLGTAERWCVRQALHALGDPPFSLVAWTGEEFAPRGAPPQGRLRLRSGSCQLYQVLFARHDGERLPWTREWIYRGVDASEAPV